MKLKRTPRPQGIEKPAHPAREMLLRVAGTVIGGLLLAWAKQWLGL